MLRHRGGLSWGLQHRGFLLLVTVMEGAEADGGSQTQEQGAQH